MRRFCLLAAAFLVACSTRVPGGTIVPQARLAARPEQDKQLSVRVAPISPDARSITVAVNGGPPQVFDATASRLSVSAPNDATDTFLVTTFAGTGGKGSALDRGSLTVSVSDSTTQISVRLAPVVGNLSDSAPGSLRNAVARARSGDDIVFVLNLPAGRAAKIVLTSGVVPIAKDLVISGPGMNALVVDANSASGIFTVSSGARVTVAGLTLMGGRAPGGGAILNGGNLVVNGIRFLQNRTVKDPSGDGGAIADVGTSGALRVLDCIFNGNSTANRTNQDRGGAIYSPSGYAVVVRDSSFVANESSNGGAAYIEGPAQFVDDAFTSNTASAGHGGALDLYGRTEIVGSTFNQNSSINDRIGSGAFGGAIESWAMATVRASTFTKNLAGGTADHASGGAIASHAASLDLDGDAFSYNEARSRTTAKGGAVSVDGAIGGAHDAFVHNKAIGARLDFGRAFGGAIEASSVALSSSAFITNTIYGYATAAGGAVDARQVAFALDSFVENSATSPGFHVPPGKGGAINVSGAAATSTLSGSVLSGNVAQGDGGGIESKGALTIVNSTIAGNKATGGSGGGLALDGSGTTALLNVTVYGNSAGFSGADIYNASSLTLENSVVGNTKASGPSDVNNSGTLSSNDYNLIESGIGGGFSAAPHDLYPAGRGAAALLPLAHNGGGTRTMADQPSSPGYNYIPLSICTGASPSVTVDQRGMPRGDGGDNLCDIGAFELQTPPSPRR